MHQRPMPATFQGDGVARCSRRQHVVGMRAAGASSDTPARGGGAGGRKARVGDEKARRRMFCRNEAQAARWRQLDFAQDADDERQALRAQALFHRPQGIGGTRRLYEQPLLRPKTEGSKAAAVWRPQFARELGWPAPKNRRGTARGSRQALQSSYAEPQRKAERRRPIAGSDTRPVQGSFHLMQGGGVKCTADAAIDLGFAKRPRRLACGR